MGGVELDTLEADRYDVCQGSVLISCRMSFLRHVPEGPTLFLLQAQRIIQILSSISLRTLLVMYILS
jgi:hypothetical protein